MLIFLSVDLPSKRTTQIVDTNRQNKSIQIQIWAIKSMLYIQLFVIFLLKVQTKIQKVMMCHENILHCNVDLIWFNN